MAVDSNAAGLRLDFRRGKGGVRRAVSDAIASIGWDEGEEGYVLVRVDRATGEIEFHRTSLREAYRLLEATIVRYGKEQTAADHPVGQLNAYGKWELVAMCADGQPRIFAAREFTPRPAARKALKPDRRFKILERDGFACRYCGRAAPDVVLHVDHVKPVARGGTSDPANLVTACQDCNLGKGARSA